MVTVSTSTDAFARFGHALSNPTRARALLTRRGSPAYPADLADLADRLGVPRLAASNHLACLLDLVLIVDPQCCGSEHSPGTSGPTLTAVTT